MEFGKVRNKIQEILLSNSVEDHKEFLFEYIPELKNMVGFEHKHPHHNLDVWGHTLAVLDNLNNVNDLELKMAGLLHDVGKPFSYQDGEVRHFYGHPEISNQLCIEILNRLGYEKDFINNVGYFVLKHDTSIEPNNLDNSYEMVKRLLILQYADARAHHPDKVQKRIDFLDNISKQLNKEIEER